MAIRDSRFIIEITFESFKYFFKDSAAVLRVSGYLHGSFWK